MANMQTVQTQDQPQPQLVLRITPQLQKRMQSIVFQGRPCQPTQQHDVIVAQPA